MPFQLPEYLAPDFDAPKFRQAPSARTAPAPRDGIAPEGFHAMSIFPEYFKVGERWLLPGESRMDRGWLVTARKSICSMAKNMS